MIPAWQAAYEATGALHWRKKALKLHARLRQLLQQPHPPRALDGQGRTLGEATLEDHALLQAASQMLGQRDRSLQHLTEQRFLTSTGWKLSAAPLLPGQSGEKWLEDGPLPSLTAIVDFHAVQRLAAQQDMLRDLAILSASYLRFRTLPR